MVQVTTTKLPNGRQMFSVDVGDLTPQQVQAIIADGFRTKVKIWLKKPQYITLHQMRDQLLDRFRVSVRLWLK